MFCLGGEGVGQHDAHQGSGCLKTAPKLVHWKIREAPSLKTLLELKKHLLKKQASSMLAASTALTASNSGAPSSTAASSCSGALSSPEVSSSSGVFSLVAPSSSLPPFVDATDSGVGAELVGPLARAADKSLGLLVAAKMAETMSAAGDQVLASVQKAG